MNVANPPIMTTKCCDYSQTTSWSLLAHTLHRAGPYAPDEALGDLLQLVSRQPNVLDDLILHLDVPEIR